MHNNNPPTWFMVIVSAFTLLAISIILLLCYIHNKRIEEQNNKANCLGEYSTFDCKVNKQIREDRELEYKEAKQKFINAGGKP